MNSNDNLPSEPSNDGDPVANGGPENAAPVKRRTRKAVAAPIEAVAGDAAAPPAAAPGDASDMPADAQGDAAQAPKAPRRRKPRAETPGEAADLAAPAGDGQRDEPRPAEAGAREGSEAPSPQAGLSQGQDTASQPAASERIAADGVADEPSAEGGREAGADAGGEVGEPGRRSRNRRRGRGKDRTGREPGEADAADAAAPREAAPRPAPAAAVLPDPAQAVERFAEVLSGAYDAEPPEADDALTLEQSTKRVLRPEPEAPKLHKVLAQSGIGSRRDMEQLIQDGGVTVNDEVAHVGMRISYGDRVKVSGKPVKLRIQGAPARLLAYHKPTGEVVSFNDPEGRPTVFRRLPRLENGKWQSVGRLDINTEGLLLFSNSGELANQLMHPRFGIEREYAVRVLGSLDDEQRARLIEGVEVDGQIANFKSIEDGGGDGANRWYRVVITEGRNREVRKLFDTCGMAVSRLIRIRYGSVVLPRGLKRGVWVELGEQDLRQIRQFIGGGRAEPREQPAHRNERPGQRNGPGPKPGKGAGRGPQPQAGRQGEARGPRREREPRPDRPFEAGREAGEGASREDFGPIPNPLEQTFDRRFAKGPRRGGAQGFGHGGSKPDHDLGPVGTIPNPLEQTFDKRFVKGSQRINAGFGRPDANPQGASPGAKKGGPKQPDPMQTSVGYIGADAYFTKVGGKRSGGGGGRGGSGGGGRFGGQGR
jgi:23S rRNA pseudouridine2605 synthase